MTTILAGSVGSASAPVESMQYSYPGTGIIIGALPVAMTTFLPLYCWPPHSTTRSAFRTASPVITVTPLFFSRKLTPPTSLAVTSLLPFWTCW